MKQPFGKHGGKLYLDRDGIFDFDYEVARDEGVGQNPGRVSGSECGAARVFSIPMSVAGLRSGLRVSGVLVPQDFRVAGNSG